MRRRTALVDSEIIRCVCGVPGRTLLAASGAVLPGALGAAGTAEFVPSASGGLSTPGGLLFRDSKLYVSSQNPHRVLRFDATDGQFLDSFVTDAGWGMTFGPDDNLYIGGSAVGNFVKRFGPASQSVFTVSLSSPSAETVTVNYDTDGGDATAGSDYTAVTNGIVVFDPGVTTRTIIVQTLNDTEIEDDETFLVTLSGEVGATITDGTGQGTILDDDTPPTLSISDATVTEGDDPVQFIDAFIPAGSGGLDAPLGMILGPDGNLYVASGEGDEVLRYNWTTGAFVDVFVAAGSGGLDRPRDMVFGSDGNLYVASGQIGEGVLRYQGPGGASPGAFIDAFVPMSSGGLASPYGLVFGPDGNLYVSSKDTDQILRYDGATGAFIDVFVTTASGGLNKPRRLEFASDGNLYVASTFSHSILRYDGTTGAFIDAFVPSGSGGGAGIFNSQDNRVIEFGTAGDTQVSEAGTTVPGESSLTT